MLKNETNGILAHYEWREGNAFFCRDHKGKVFRSVRSYETLAGNSKKALFVVDEDFNAEEFKQPNAIQLYERKIKKIKIDTREIPELTLSLEDEKEHAQTLKQFKSNKPKTIYDVIGYRFTPFPSKPRITKSKIDEKSFIERLSHASYKKMLLADIKLLLQLQEESSIELSKFLAIVITSYRENLDSEQEVKAFQKIVEKLIRTAKAPKTKKHYFYINENEEDGIYVS